MGTVEAVHTALVDFGAYELRVPSRRELAAFLDQGLRHHRRELKSLQAVASASQLELYDTLNADHPPDSVIRAPLPTKSIDTLATYETSVDIGARIQLWRAGNERRSDPNIKMQLALAEIELRHTRSTGEQTQERLRASETKAEAARRGFEAERQGLTTKLAKRDAELRGLATELAKREERIRSSRQTTELVQGATSRPRRESVQTGAGTARPRNQARHAGRDDPLSPPDNHGRRKEPVGTWRPNWPGETWRYESSRPSWPFGDVQLQTSRKTAEEAQAEGREFQGEVVRSRAGSTRTGASQERAGASQGRARANPSRYRAGPRTPKGAEHSAPPASRRGCT